MRVLDLVVSVLASCGLGMQFCFGILAIYSRHPALSSAFIRRSSMSLKYGASKNRLPGDPISSCIARALWTSLSRGDLRICPSHLKRLTRILYIKLRLVEEGRASSWMLLPVILESILLFVPFSVLITFVDKSQVSQPYVKIEHIAAS